MKIANGIIGKTKRSMVRLYAIGAVVFTTLIVIINKTKPINKAPESPINTLRFVLKLKGK